MAKWEMMCREQGTKCEILRTHALQKIIRDRFHRRHQRRHSDVEPRQQGSKRTVSLLRLLCYKPNSMKATKTRVTSLSQTTEEEISYMKGNSQKMKQRPRNQKLPFKQNTCPWCGDTPHPKGKDDCPAKGKQCYACGRLDHLGKVCLHPNPNWRENRGQSTNSRTPGRLQTDSVHFTDAESTLVDNFCLDTIYSNAVNDCCRGKKYFTFLEVKAKPQSSTTTIRFQIGLRCHMQCATTALPQTAGASTPGTKHIHNEHVQQ